MTFAHIERSDEDAAGVDAERHAYLADASLLDEDGDEVLVRKLEADDREFAKEFFRSQRRFSGGVDR